MGKNQQRRRAEKQQRRVRRNRERTAGPPSGPAPSGSAPGGAASSGSAPGGAASSGSAPSGSAPPGGGWGDGYCFEHGCYHDGRDAAPRPADVRGLLVAAARASKRADIGPMVDELMRADRSGGGRAGREATAVLLDFVGTMYEHGWQPADLMHVAHKKFGSGGEWLVAALLDRQARASRAESRAPDEWCAQLATIRESFSLPGDGDSAVEWFGANGWTPDGASREIVAVLGATILLPALEELLPPPSRWPRERASRGGDSATRGGGGDSATRGGVDGDSATRGGHPPPGSARFAGPRSDASSGRGGGAPTGAGGSAGHDPKMLARIRSLLAKAESTDFPDEAEALTSKAQELMSRYAIDEALLESHRAVGSSVRARRVHIDSPYASTKVRLLTAVGGVNRVRVIWFDSVDMATVVGFPIDLDLVEMLYTSLLVQATRAMTEHGRGSPGARSVSFRKAFLIAYAQRIGERLAEADAQAAAAVTGAELVLARRSREVDEEFDRLFPHTVQTRSRRLNAHGYHAGLAAADRARIAQGQLAAHG